MMSNSNTGTLLQVNHAELTDPHQPLAFGDFVEVVPCDPPQPFSHKHAAPWYAGYGGYHVFPKPQLHHQKYRPPVEQQRQQLNSMYKMPSDDQHSPTDVWKVSSTELTTPPQRHGQERRPVAS